ncbi:receptor-type tyrosine-protein phosphatase mu-like [Ruditapes philippinarum]|uniref:receptor-type tyrosine-protein phosphatase mu-like n=1 Tax=Ruditapes philippinarum TaxID=129788 RepID=UPI00295B0477|nr:receptor-type tyrosine-protein phosphatase mu-like [Ruditapes philippinarum]
MDGYRQSRRYIASLGPTSKTTNDFETFWQMIWHEKSDLIVMLTNLREHSGMKCEQYWPNEASLCQYGQVTVTSKNTEVFAEYTIRKFTVSKEDEHRSLTHLHYTAWPDKTVPEDVTTLLEFRKRLKSTPTTSEGPMVVHCSAGIGRTGTLIAIDRLIEEGLDKGSVNVFECVKNMREQRVKMVQTLEQYIYIHKALVMALTFRAEAVPVEQIREYVNRSNGDMFSMLFQQLQQTIETDSEAEQKARIKNKERSGKNRRGADIPGSRFSIFLHLNREGDESEYINAVYINSFKKKDHFIAAQSPLPSTVEDFLALIYQENCSCIVAMEDLNEPGMTVGVYLPEEKKTLTVGNFKVSCSRLETKKSHIIRKMKIKYTGKYESGERSIIHFQYTQWIAENDIPGNTSEFVQFANEVEEYANELGDEKSPVVVHCLKANERIGLFCGVIILMEKIKYERRVNILDSLRHLRTRRPSAITSQKQLEFCYQAASAYTNLHMKNI